MVYNTISVKKIIAKVFSDLDLKEGDHRISDLIEWAGESLKKIGAFPALITKVMGKDGLPLLNVTNYQTALPCDLHSINQVAFTVDETGPFYAMRYASGNFDTAHQLTSEMTTATDTDVVRESDLVILTQDLFGDTYEEALARLSSDASLKARLIGLLATQRNVLPEGGTTYSSEYTYTITPGYLKTNLKTGYILLSYQAIPTDIDGYPLIPDDEAFEEAIYWYINMKLMYPEWKAGRVRDAVYYDARRSWNYHRRQAYGNAMMPNADQLESIKNSWLRLLPNIDEHKTFFSTLGEKQLIYNQNK